MLRSAVRICCLIALIATCATAKADAITDNTVEDSVSTPPRLNSPVGLGAMLDKLQGETGYSFVVEGENHFNQRKGAFGFTRYGEGESRLEIGNGFGVSLAATSGFTVVGVKKDESFSPFVGVEPLSGRINLNTNGARENYYEYLPMAAVGPQFAVGSCRILSVARAGGAAGTLHQSGILPGFGTAYGVGGYVDCARFDLSAEATRVVRGGQLIDLRLADLFLPSHDGQANFGIRGEQNLEPDHSEQRILLLFRSRLGG